VDSFLTFMDATRRGDMDTRANSGLSTRAEVLAQVSSGDGGAKFDQLQSGLKLTPADLSEAITWLSDNGLLEVQAGDDPNEPTYALTDHAVRALNKP